MYSYGWIYVQENKYILLIHLSLPLKKNTSLHIKYLVITYYITYKKPIYILYVNQNNKNRTGIL